MQADERENTPHMCAHTDTQSMSGHRKRETETRKKIKKNPTNQTKITHLDTVGGKIKSESSTIQFHLNGYTKCTRNYTTEDKKYAVCVFAHL